MGPAAGPIVGGDAVRIKTIRVAVADAKRFIERAAIAISEGRDDEDIWSSKASGALRRASLDLTRSLADMRKP